MKIACLVKIDSLELVAAAGEQPKLRLADGCELSLKHCTPFGAILELDIRGDVTVFPFSEVVDRVMRVEALEDLGYSLVVSVGVLHLKDFSAILLRRDPTPLITYLARNWDAWCDGRRRFFAECVKERPTAL